MLGYYVYFACCPTKALGNRSFVSGVEAPDLLKKYYEIYNGSKGAAIRFNRWRGRYTPEYKELEKRVEQKKSIGSTDGLHYGLSTNPDVRVYWDGLDEVKKAKFETFYRGYVWHLLTDKLIYNRLDIEKKLKKELEENKEHVSRRRLKKMQAKKLRNDWRIVNSLIKKTYPDVKLPYEIRSINLVKYAEGELVYVDWEVLKKTIDYLRAFDSLNGDMDRIIKKVLKEIK